MVDVKSVLHDLLENVEKVMVGKRAEVESALIALVCEGHVLIEDVPGVGKTVLAKALARSIGCSFKRLQFTPDLLPSDVTGVSIFNQKTGEFEFRAGPIIAQIVLADEINRATPKTQAALLEAMEERQVTVDGATFRMPRPFLVMATQNPIEYEGTFPLPEAQLDRFLMRIRLGYPDRDREVEILDRQQYSHPLDQLGQVVTAEDLLAAQAQVKEVAVSPPLRGYIVDIVSATRDHPDVYLGASPRGSLSLFRTAQARALMAGRDYVLPDDVKALAEPVLAHRLIINPASRIKNVDASLVIREMLDSLPVPGGRVSVSMKR
ncbi:MAG: AAA family ATPase [Chloroflexota bacterium]